MIKLKVEHFKTHKLGETKGDCQDHYAHNEETGRYAIADGATLSFLPKEWAKLLVTCFCYPKDIEMSLDDNNWEGWLEPIQQDWLESVSRTVQDSKSYILVDRLSKLESALSTFIGIEFDQDEEKWKALIIGDSCLFHRSGTEFKCYPFQKLEDFPYRPNSFASFSKDNPIGDPPEIISGKVSIGDVFILATDALSKWIFQHSEAGNLNCILDRLKKIENREQFEQFVEQSRNEEVRLVNDDVTLMIFTVEESELSEDAEETDKLLSESLQPASNLVSFFFWAIIVGVSGFILGFIVLALILLDKK